MKYLFALVPHQDVDMFGKDDLFEADGDYYFNQVEIGTNPGGMEDFTISDTCGRSIPLSTDSIDALIELLMDIKDTLEVIETGQTALQSMYSNEFTRVFD